MSKHGVHQRPGRWKRFWIAGAVMGLLVVVVAWAGWRMWAPESQEVQVDSTPVTSPEQGAQQVDDGPRRWKSGAAGEGVGADSQGFGDWRGSPVTIAGTWNDNVESQEHLWSIRDSFTYAKWERDLDMAVGGIFKDEGESWSAAADGAYDDRWRRMFETARDLWQGRRGTLYIRFAHEFNGHWYAWSVTGDEVEDFKATWRRVHAMKEEIFPKSKLVFAANSHTNVEPGYDWTTAFPGAEYVDVLAVDYYNQNPFVDDREEFDSRLLEVDEWGGPSGLESHRQFAEEQGLPLAVPEWSSNADYGDSPVFVEAFHDWLAEHGGRGPGKVLYEILFNVREPYGDKFTMHPVTRQPEAARTYAELW